MCADRMAWLRELIAAGEAGPGNELPTPDWRREMDLERGAKVPPRVAGGRIRPKRQRGSTQRSSGSASAASARHK